MDLNRNDIGKHLSCGVIVPPFPLNPPHAFASVLSMHYSQSRSFIMSEKSSKLIAIKTLVFQNIIYFILLEECDLVRVALSHLSFFFFAQVFTVG